jgi:choline dehydrogenase-like flavoprotein
MKEHRVSFIGAGSAGCTLAARLTEDADVNVLLLEAGGWDHQSVDQAALRLGQVLRDRIYSWNYETESPSRRSTTAGSNARAAR